MNVEMTAQFSHATRNSLNREISVSSAIMHLLKGRCPPAVFRFIVTILVRIPVKRFTEWSLAHVGKEVFKFIPSGADTNSPVSIMLKTASLWIRAALNHSRPCLVRGRKLFAAVATNTRMSVGYKSGFRKLTSQAATRTRFPIFEETIVHFDFVSTFTKTKTAMGEPPARKPKRWGFANYSKTLKLLADQISFSRHNVMALCLAAAFGYRPDVCRDSFMPQFEAGVNT